MALERIIIAKKFILTWMCVLKKFFFGRLHHIDLLTQRSELTNERKRTIIRQWIINFFLFWCKQVVSIIFYYSTFTSRMGNRNREEREEKKLWILFFSTEYSMSSSTVKWNDRFLSMLAVDEVALHWGDVFP